MDEKDELILDLLEGNARMGYQELGDHLGISRVAAKKRVDKLEKYGIIRGYNACIHIVAVPDSVRDFTHLVRMITNRCSKDAEEIRCYTVKEIIRDVYGGVSYDQRTAVSDGDGIVQQVQGSETKR